MKKLIAGVLLITSISSFADCTVEDVASLPEINWSVELGSDGCNRQVGYPVVENAILQDDGSCSVFVNYMESGTQVECNDSSLIIPSPKYVVNKIRVKYKLKRTCKKLEKKNIICM